MPLGFSNTAPAAPRPERGRGLSLAWRLSLLTTTLLVLGVGALLVGTYDALLASSAARARGRIETTARELAARSAASGLPRQQRMAALARAPDFRDAVAAGRDSAAIATRLEAIDVHAPDTASVLLLDREGRPRVLVGDAIAPGELPAIPAALLPDSVWVGPITHDRRGSHIWTVVAVGGPSVVPVEGRPRPVGYVATHRRIAGSRDLPRQLRALAGDSVTVYLHNRDGSGWIEVWGEPARPPARRITEDDQLHHEHANGTRVLAVEAPVARTPWVVTLELPEGSIVTAPRRTMRALVLLALAIVLTGGWVAFVLGRRMTRPLAAITGAAEEVARGTYEHAVVEERGDEIGRLAGSFDAMARQVVAARRELEQRAADAQALATRLGEANNRLTLAMAEAEDARRVAEDASRAKSDFLAVMSHELRTPLNAIGGYAELLEMELRGPLTPQQREDLARIRRSQRHLLALIEDVLGFARIDSGKLEFSMREVAVGEALAEIDALVAPQAAAREIALVVEPVPAHVVVRADVEKLRQVVLNLLANAIKFTPAGGRVTLRVDADRDAAYVHVRDTGPGIAPEQLARIFEPFEQGNRALNRPAEGVGLGLTISRDLARGMGGTVTVESAPGEGATFTVVMPRVGDGALAGGGYGPVASGTTHAPPG